MARKMKYVVRVVIPSVENQPPLAPQIPDEFLESLRYAQLVALHRNDSTGQCFDLLCPHGLDSKVWAEQNAERMQTLGFNAVCAPQWGGEEV